MALISRILRPLPFPTLKIFTVNLSTNALAAEFAVTKNFTRHSLSASEFKVRSQSIDSLEIFAKKAADEGIQFKDYGKHFISQLKVENWQLIASTSPSFSYNKILIENFGKCSLFIISWRPFSGSKEHTHHDNGCWFKVIEDQNESAVLTEIRRDLNGRITTHRAYPGEPGFIHNSMGSHLVHNETPSWVHSLHLYPRES